MRSHHSQAREGWQASLKGHQGHKATATVFNAVWGKSTTDLQSAVVGMAAKAFCHAWASALGSCRVISWHVYNCTYMHVRCTSRANPLLCICTWPVGHCSVPWYILFPCLCGHIKVPVITFGVKFILLLYIGNASCAAPLP